MNRKRWIVWALIPLLVFGLAVSAAAATGTKQIEAIYRELSILVDNKLVSSDVEPFIATNRTMVPIRFIAQALGQSVLWDQDKAQVRIDAPLTLTASDSGKTVSLRVGEVLSILLSGNPAAGFLWKVTEDDASLLQPLPETPPQVDLKVPGAVPGPYDFRFVALAPARTNLKLAYQGPATPGKPSQEFSLTVNIANSFPLFPVFQNGKWGYIDDSGRMLLPPQYDQALDFSEGLAGVQAGDSFDYIDVYGDKIFGSSYFYQEVGYFEDGLAPVLATVQDLGNRFGFIDKAGRRVIDLNFIEALDFSEGRAVVRTSTQALSWGHIDTAGNLIGPANHADAQPFSEGLARVLDALQSGMLWGYVDRNGNQAIAPQFAEAFPFSDGLAAVGNGAQYAGFGFIDRSGTMVLPAIYDQVASFSEGLAAVKQAAQDLGEVWSLIDTSGKRVVDLARPKGSPQIEEVRAFSGGLAAAWMDGKWGYLDHSGSFAITPQFTVAQDFQHGLAYVQVDGKEGFINSTGGFVWGPFPLPPAP
ncbi:MAG: WG repeat-containing protein [bacterium]